MGNIQRDNVVDSIRGFAIIIVMLGHIMTTNTLAGKDTGLFRFIWSVQMPLFMLISGYVNKYAKPVDTISDLIHTVKKRTISYFLPWLVWTLLIRGWLVNPSEDIIEYTQHIVFNMDSGYWFLFVLWMISLTHLLSKYFVGKIIHNRLWMPIAVSLMSIAFGGMAYIVITYSQLGGNFLGFKYYIYYLPFYCIGFIYGDWSVYASGSVLFSKKILKNGLSAIVFLIYISLMCKIDITKLQDEFFSAILRFVMSITGSIVVINIIVSLSRHSYKLSRACSIAGNYSLELYLLHTLFIPTIPANNSVAFVSLEGIGVSIINYLFMILFSSVFIYASRRNQYINFFIFGKNDRKE